MAGPAAGDHQPFAHGGPGDGAHHRHLLSAAHIQPQNRIAIFIILKNHGADSALEDLQFLIQGFFSPVQRGNPLFFRLRNRRNRRFTA